MAISHSNTDLVKLENGKLARASVMLGPDGQPLALSEPALAPYAGDQATVSTSVLTLSPAEYAQDNTTVADMLTVMVVTNSIRYRFGWDPTTAAGSILSAGESIDLEGEETIAAFRMIRNGGSDATVEFIPQKVVTG